MTVLQNFFEALRRFGAKGGAMRSSHLALSFLLAIFPFCLFALSLAGALSPESHIDDVIAFAIGAWPDAIANSIESELRAVLQAGSSTLTFGAVLAIFFASNGVQAIRLVITEAYRDTDPRPFWKTRALSILFVLAGSCVIVVAGSINVVVPLTVHYFDDLVPWLSQSILSNDQFRQLVTLSISVFFLFACHKWLPGVSHSTRELVPGIVLCMFLWWAVSKGFAFYLSSFATYSVTYAGLAGIMSTLVYLYLLSAIFVLGAEFNGQLMDAQKSRESAAA
ncbi:YihY/virulence factor BrkB family protein [Shimia sp. R10_1]|uniref:YihY/virulence factor BrkB family protein n=1 Tax=Shimia sp. R10_1 TaxID=2821095 RepID=UPI0032AF0FFC